MTDVLYSGSMVMVGRGRGCVVVNILTEKVEEFDDALVPLRFSYWRADPPDDMLEEAERILGERP